MPSMDTLKDLLDRVTGASGSDRELDQDLYEHVGGCQPDAEGMLNVYRAPAYTASIDAAVGLVERVLPKGWWSVEDDCLCDYTAAVSRVSHMQGDEGQLGNGATAPLALLDALLKALIAKATRSAAIDEMVRISQEEGLP